MAHAGPVTGRTSEAMELVCEAVGDDHIRQVQVINVSCGYAQDSVSK